MKVMNNKLWLVAIPIVIIAALTSYGHSKRTLITFKDKLKINSCEANPHKQDKTLRLVCSHGDTSAPFKQKSFYQDFLWTQILLSDISLLKTSSFQGELEMTVAETPKSAKVVNQFESENMKCQSLKENTDSYVVCSHGDTSVSFKVPFVPFDTTLLAADLYLNP